MPRSAGRELVSRGEQQQAIVAFFRRFLLGFVQQRLSGRLAQEVYPSFIVLCMLRDTFGELNVYTADHNRMTRFSVPYISGHPVSRLPVTDAAILEGLLALYINSQLQNLQPELFLMAALVQQPVFLDINIGTRTLYNMTPAVFMPDGMMFTQGDLRRQASDNQTQDDAQLELRS